MRKAILCSLLLLLVVGGLQAQNFPRPEFTQGEQLPHTTVPAPRAEVFATLDVVVLVVALG
ncbi:MAG: hypothetical protein WCP21_20915, partial [Armatimonadota bacterium]